MITLSLGMNLKEGPGCSAARVRRAMANADARDVASLETGERSPRTRHAALGSMGVRTMLNVSRVL